MGMLLFDQRAKIWEKVSVFLIHYTSNNAKDSITKAKSIIQSMNNVANLTNFL